MIRILAFSLKAAIINFYISTISSFLSAVEKTRNELVEILHLIKQSYEARDIAKRTHTAMK